MRLIDADALYETLCHVWDRSDSEEFEQAVFKVIANAPTADRPTGEWVWSDEDASWTCGCCDCVFEEIDWKPDYNYCPNCGARMTPYKGGDTE